MFFTASKRATSIPSTQYKKKFGIKKGLWKNSVFEIKKVFLGKDIIWKEIKLESIKNYTWRSRWRTWGRVPLLPSLFSGFLLPFWRSLPLLSTHCYFLRIYQLILDTKNRKIVKEKEKWIHVFRSWDVWLPNRNIFSVFEDFEDIPIRRKPIHHGTARSWIGTPHA